MATCSGKQVVRFLVTLTAWSVGVAGVCSLVYFDLFDTELAPGFDKKLWDQVSVGMSEAEVKSMLGQPLIEDVSADGQVKMLSYSKSPSDNKNYVHYYLIVHDGKVTKKQREVFWD